MNLRPIPIKRALSFCATTHRRLPALQGAMWAVALYDDAAALIGVAIVGRPARLLQTEDYRTLSVLRVAVVEGHKNGCSMLYGACSRAARAMGAADLITYTHLDEPGTSLRASGWIDGGLTSGGEHSRAKRPRAPAKDAGPKRRWFAPWGVRAMRLFKRAGGGEVLGYAALSSEVRPTLCDSIHRSRSTRS